MADEKPCDDEDPTAALDALVGVPGPVPAATPTSDDEDRADER